MERTTYEWISRQFLTLPLQSKFMQVIENEWLKVSIQPKGAELTGFCNKKTGLDYMWDGNPVFWPKHSPVLFPIVGTLTGNQYLYKEKPYSLNRHGFAREQLFDIEKSEATRVTFLLTDTDATQQVFPFAFSLRVHYILNKDHLAVQYEVMNNSDGPMYFSIGAHPAFKVPLVPGSHYNDYYLEFEHAEKAPRWMITPEGLISRDTVPVLENSNHLPLSKPLFYKDAIVFKGLRSQRIHLRSIRDEHGITMNFPGFPFFGIWAARDADFVCLEPWCGIADREDTNQDFISKEGIETIGAGDQFTRTWSVHCF